MLQEVLMLKSERKGTEVEEIGKGTIESVIGAARDVNTKENEKEEQLQP